MAQIHRFRDCVAVALGSQTVYLRPAEARKIASAIYGATRDIEARPFIQSEFRTMEIATAPLTSGTGIAADYQHKRKES